MPFRLRTRRQADSRLWWTKSTTTGGKRMSRETARMVIPWRHQIWKEPGRTRIAQRSRLSASVTPMGSSAGM
ncbi:MAG: hypothetical protein M3Q44_03935 [bacterium]|nr:hypothetical protein [bacterium]